MPNSMPSPKRRGAARFPPGKPLGQLIYTFSWCYRRQYYSILLLHRVFRVPQANRVRNKDRSKHATTTRDDAIPSSEILRDPLRSCIESKNMRIAIGWRQIWRKDVLLLLVVEAPLRALLIAPRYYRTRRNAPYPRAIRMRYT